MGGQISVESELGKGSTFSFEIFLEATEEPFLRPMPKRRRVPEEGQALLRQLVADDKATNRELLTEYLKLMGFPVQCVSDGEEAVAAWQTWQPQVIWMDMRMPRLDGYEATRRIRALEAQGGRPRTTILAVTASAFEQDREAVLAAGCDAILHKPFREEELFEALARFAGVRFREEADHPDLGHGAGAPSLDGLDPAWRQAFFERLRAGDVQEARLLVAQLPPAQGSLGSYLRQSLEAFQLDELERLFTPPEGP
jgi:CheY-like chemotaxis protein